MNQLLSNKDAVIYGAGGAIGARSQPHSPAKAPMFTSRVGPRHRSAGSQSRSSEMAAPPRLPSSMRSCAAGPGAAAFTAAARHLLERDLARGRAGRPLAEKEVEEVMRPVLGIRSTLITARAASRQMIKQGSGMILWLTSGSSTGGAPGMGGTGAADAATDNYMRQLARETGRQGLRVCGIWTAGVYETFGLVSER